MNTEDYTVSTEDAVARLAIHSEDDTLRVHTFRSMPMGLIGADWDLSDVKALMETAGVETSGDQATAMGHGLVIVQDEADGGPLFLATRSAE